MESEFDHGLKESESDLLPSKKNSSSDEELHDSSMETYHQIGTPFISYKTGSKKNRILVENKSRSAQRAQLREIDYINKLKLKINAEKAKLSLLPLQVFRDELIIFQMQKTNNALKKKVEALNKNKTDAQAKYQELTKECDSLMIMWMKSKEIK
ncbi:hypothetical protein AAG906_037162 [Vitis piasezkii]